MAMNQSELQVSERHLAVSGFSNQNLYSQVVVEKRLELVAQTKSKI